MWLFDLTRVWRALMPQQQTSHSSHDSLPGLKGESAVEQGLQQLSMCLAESLHFCTNPHRTGDLESPAAVATPYHRSRRPLAPPTQTGAHPQPVRVHALTQFAGGEFELNDYAPTKISLERKNFRELFDANRKVAPHSISPDAQHTVRR